MIAPYVLDGAINAELFVAYVEQVLVPTLRGDDIVIMDTFPSIRSRPSVAPSKRPEPNCCSCRPIALTSIQLRWSSPK